MTQSTIADQTLNAVSNSDAVSNSTTASADFIERRQLPVDVGDNETERRQFGSSHFGLTDDGRDLALAIDQYKLQNHRRYLTCDEMLQVLTELGYEKSGS